jgi:phenylalanine-4-hydroxylase
MESAGVATAEVTLPAGHPGAGDEEYCARRAAITRAAAAYRPPAPIPEVTYSAEEDGIWRLVSAELAAKHARLACREYRTAAATLALPGDRVPQLRAVDARLGLITGFHIAPAAGLVPPRDFYGALAHRTFLSTQYIRHHSTPFYTPEPDIVHEMIGHANMLASPRLADLYQAAGRASDRAESDAAHAFFSRVFWFTLEFGVVWEEGELRTYGAGLLSSFGEIDAFRGAEVRAWDLAAMGRLDYDITHYQPVLFAAASFDRMADDLQAFFDGFDDETFARMTSRR